MPRSLEAAVRPRHCLYPPSEAVLRGLRAAEAAAVALLLASLEFLRKLRLKGDDFFELRLNMEVVLGGDGIIPPPPPPPLSSSSEMPLPPPPPVRLACFSRRLPPEEERPPGRRRQKGSGEARGLEAGEDPFDLISPGCSGSGTISVEEGEEPREPPQLPPPLPIALQVAEVEKLLPLSCSSEWYSRSVEPFIRSRRRGEVKSASLF